MHKMFVAYVVAAMLAIGAVPAGAQSVTVTPNQQTTSASAVSNPTGQNISQQNNFYDPGSNSFGPGVSCAGPYLASSLYRNDSSTPGTAGSGFANVGGTVGLVVPLNGTNKKCQEFVNEILFQRQIDTCLSMARQGFSFDPDGQYATLAKRCQGIRYTGQPISSATPLSPPPPPTVITIPASPSAVNAVPIPSAAGQHAELDATIAPAARSGDARPVVVAMHLSPLCQRVAVKRKHELMRRVKGGSKQQRRAALDELRAACIPDADIMAAL